MFDTTMTAVQMHNDGVMLHDIAHTTAVDMQRTMMDEANRMHMINQQMMMDMHHATTDADFQREFDAINNYIESLQKEMREFDRCHF